MRHEAAASHKMKSHPGHHAWTSTCPATDSTGSPPTYILTSFKAESLLYRAGAFDGATGCRSMIALQCHVKWFKSGGKWSAVGDTQTMRFVGIQGV